MNEARPKLTGPTGLFRLALMVLAFTVISGMALFLLVDCFYLDSPHALIPLLIFAPIPGFFFGIWHARNLRNRQRWVLTETELIGGVSSRKIFPLASIKKNIIGLPTPGAIPVVDEIPENNEPGTSTNLSRALLDLFFPELDSVRRDRERREFQRERTLLLIFNDGALLPLYLLSASNGDALEAELQRKLIDRLLFNYNYSSEQARILSAIKANMLIPANKSPRFAFDAEPSN
jgi:hypothetical protein